MRADVQRSRDTARGAASAGPARTRTAWLLMDIVMAILVLASTARYVINHGLNDLDSSTDRDCNSPARAALGSRAGASGR